MTSKKTAAGSKKTTTKKKKAAAKKATAKKVTAKKAAAKKAIPAPQSRAKATPKRATSSKPARAKSGTPFEIRARDALKHVYPALTAEHNVRLPMQYAGRRRQFDVILRDGERLDMTFEAKDYGHLVPIKE